MFPFLAEFSQSGYPLILDRAIAPGAVKVSFLSWNPLNPPAIPNNASILWLEANEISCPHPDRRIPNRAGNGNVIGTWNLAGTTFDGIQETYKLDCTPVYKITFSLWTNLGPVPVIPDNNVVVMLHFDTEF